MAIHASALRSFKAIRCAVTVEPMLFCYFLSTVISTTVGSNLLLRKGCDPEATVAPDLQNSSLCLMEKQSQHTVAAINVWKHIIQELMSLMFIMFAGPWSDNHGRRRRPLMFVPVFGQILCDALNILFSVLWHVSPAVTGIAQALTSAATGTFHCFLIGVFAYLSDVTDESSRTMRLGFASAILPLSAALGFLSFGYLNVKLGFVGVFALNIGLNVLGLCLGILFIYDSSVPYKPPSGSLYKTTFNPAIVVKSFKIIFIKREFHKRIVLILMVIASPLTGAPFAGETSLLYLYLRNRFGFNEIDFSMFNGYILGVMLLGSVFALGILSRVLRMNDSLIGLISTVFDIATILGFIFVNQFKYLLFVPPFELFRGAALALGGSIASKCVKPDELGSMNSVKMIMENVTKVVILPLYNIVYNYTLETMPSAYFIISLCLTVPLLGCFGTTYYYTRNQAVTPNPGDNLESNSNDVNVDSPNKTNVIAL